MRKIVMVLFMAGCLSGQCYAGTGKLIAGVLMTLAGASIANSGFELRDVSRTEYVTVQDKQVDQEWDYRYRIETYKNFVYDSATTYVDPNPSSIAYQWSWVDLWDIGTADEYDFVTYNNHHITYKNVAITSPVTVTTKEVNSPTLGVGGVIIASIGINFLFDYLNKDMGWFSKNNLKFHLAQYNDRVNLSLQYRI